ncbi:hypothetical protein H6P81_001766 [Aristolochia fimbriata]|uniref:Fatty acyl-CoA reductase n=1 Tax=Aristolochia fimbriata TaxID=158543 RepID=A0AAV7F8H1_ARIFI|nr:hypothetical protein H6P81_001766 [Aristolochia fimbriata]
MENDISIEEYLHGKSILVTGSTGYLAKIFVEKVLRIQPEVKRIYLLIRAPSEVTAAQRLETDVVSKDLFRILRDVHGDSFGSFISLKVIPIAGNTAHVNIGVDDSCVREKLFNELDVIVHSAATTSFDERYDIALSTNTFGAKNVLEFSKKCVKLGMLLHVSTAFVGGEKEGLILERPFGMGEALHGTSTIDIYKERTLVETKLKELEDNGATNEGKAVFMKELGLQRARSFGWPNTYSFTKAMAEMLLGNLKDQVPLVIVRPSVVTSTYVEPFPGWIENTRTIDAVIIPYALGKMKCFLGDPDGILDMIPGDMVVNAMLKILSTHFLRSSQHSIYHLCSSLRNPTTISNLVAWSYLYFSDHPLVGKDGNVIKVPRLLLNIHYKVPLQVFYILNFALCHLYNAKYKKLNKQYHYAKTVALLYKPYTTFKGRFDDSSSEWFRACTSKGDPKEKLYYPYVEDIKWESYFMTVHIPAVIKYLMK